MWGAWTTVARSVASKAVLWDFPTVVSMVESLVDNSEFATAGWKAADWAVSSAGLWAESMVAK